MGKLDKGKMNDVTNVRLRIEEHCDFCKKLVTFPLAQYTQEVLTVRMCISGGK